MIQFLAVDAVFLFNSHGLTGYGILQISPQQRLKDLSKLHRLSYKTQRVDGVGDLAKILDFSGGSRYCPLGK